MAIGTQISRTPMATALMTPACTSRGLSSPGPTVGRKVASCSPMRMKRTPLRRKTKTSHTARAWRRVAGATASLRCWRRYSPPATQASTAETCRRSAAIQLT